MSLNRRTFLATSALALTAPGLSALAFASSMETYSEEAYKKAVADGESFLVAVLSTW